MFISEKILPIVFTEYPNIPDAVNTVMILINYSNEVVGVMSPYPTVAIVILI